MRFYVDVTQEDIDLAIGEAQKRARGRRGCDGCPIDYAVARMLPGGRSEDVHSGYGELEWKSAEIGIPSPQAVRFMHQIDATTEAIVNRAAKIPKPPKPCRLSFLVP